MRTFIESNGDYRREKALEQGKPLFAAQDSLPPLPVAPLRETCDRFLASVKALVSPEQYRATQAVVQEFCKPGERSHTTALDRMLQLSSNV